VAAVVVALLVDRTPRDVLDRRLWGGAGKGERLQDLLILKIVTPLLTFLTPLLTAVAIILPILAGLLSSLFSLLSSLL